MAVRLPDASSLGRRPVPQGSRAIAQQDTESAGRALAGLGATIGSSVGGAIEQYQKEDDAQAVFGARRKLDEWERAAIYDPEKGAVSKTGQAAFKLPDELAKSYDEFAGKVAGELKTERQRRAFSEVSMSRRSQVLDWASKHSAREREVYAETEYKADLASFQDRAARIASLPTDGTAESIAQRDARVAAEIATGQQRIIGRMREKGMPGDAIALATQDFATKAHMGVMAQMLAAGDPKSAEKYLSANEKAIDPESVAKVRGALRDSVSLGDAQSAADEVMARGLTGQAALDEVRTRFKDNPTTRARAESEVKTRLAEQDALKAREAKDTAREAWSIVVERGTLSAIPRDTMAKLNALAPEEERQMRDWVEAKARRAKADAEGKAHVETGEQTRTYLQMVEMAIDRPADFAGMSVEAFARLEPALTKEHFNKLTAMRVGINKDEAKVVQIGKLAKGAIAEVRNVIAAQKIELTGKDRSKDKIEEAQRLEAAIYDAIDAAAATGPVDAKKARELALGQLKMTYEQGSGSFFGMGAPKQVPAFKREPGKQYISTRYNDIPADIRGELEAAARKANGGMAASSDEIERMYQRAVDAGRIK